MNKNNPVPYLKSLASCLRRIVRDGYTEDFRVDDLTLASISTNRSYQPQQIDIVSLFKFEGNSDPSDNAMLYVIETSDGVRGTLVASDEEGSDSVRKFMKAVERKNRKKDSK